MTRENPVYKNALVGSLVGGRYQVAAFIREGGMASVYCCTQEGDPPHVALKILHPRLAAQQSFVTRFLREGRALARLEHPNVVRTFGTGEDRGLLFIVMELLIGDDLVAPIRVDGGVTERRAASIAAQVCRALDHAHGQGIVHRDIKPENVMLVRNAGSPIDPVVKVLDFGIVKLFDAPDTDPPDHDTAPTGLRSYVTRVGTLVGTPAYMSPEQGRAEPVGPAHDIYGSGVLLFELLTGKKPFVGSTPLETVMKHVNAPIPPLDEHLPVDPELAAVVTRALQKRPEDRFRTAGDMAAALEALVPRLATVPRAKSFRLTESIRLPASNAGPMAVPAVGEDTGDGEVTRQQPRPADPVAAGSPAAASPPNVLRPFAQVQTDVIAPDRLLPGSLSAPLVAPPPKETKPEPRGDAASAVDTAAVRALERTVWLLLALVLVSVAASTVAIVLLLGKF